MIKLSLVLFFMIGTLSGQNDVKIIALWPFDEQVGIYPSCVISDLSDNDYPLVLGPGGQIVPGKYGNALEATEQPEIIYPEDDNVKFGLLPVPIPEGRTIEPMTWMNANFCALMTSGENHLRKQVGFINPTKTKLNLGQFDWTIEFWFQPGNISDENGVVFEIGQGPRGENNAITQLQLNPGLNAFIFINQPGNLNLIIPTNKDVFNVKSKKWLHIAFTYQLKTGQLLHFINGKIQKLPETCKIIPLPQGEEDYMTIGRDGNWKNPMSGRIDELCFSEGLKYQSDFNPPNSMSYVTSQQIVPKKVAAKQLLFSEEQSPIQLGNRKYLFIDDALVDKSENVIYSVNPPKLAERVIENIRGPFRKHLNVLEDENGLLRMYNAVDDDYLAVRTSKDGINWEIPELPQGKYKTNTNIVLHQSTGMGMVFIDPNAPPKERWKYISDYHRRGVSLFYSPDGWQFERYKIPVLPFRSGSQANLFYDDQRQVYVSYHRSDFTKTLSGDTERTFVMTETSELVKPWPFEPVSQKQSLELAKTNRVHDLHPWYLDNGPLTPGGFAFEYPYIFRPDEKIDPRETDIYVPKAMKYPWADDTYIAFPVVYFHYEESTPLTRVILMDPDRKRGSGPIETQLATSRDGINWKRYPRPAYVGTGLHENWPVNQAYMAHGMVRRGNEIWQYYFGTEIYHSTWSKDKSKSAVYRTVQRFDGFVSADTPYKQEGYLITKPMIFEGNKLVLNIDTDAAGYAQVGFLDENNKPIPGFSVDDCIYINGDFIETEVEWFPNWRDFPSMAGKKIEELKPYKDKFKFTKDVSALEGKIVQVVFRMRGAKLYSMQFVSSDDATPPAGRR
jgi:hypothetical protein